MSVHDDYKQLRDGIALVERADRGLVEVRGRDRLTWLHSFVTNAVKHLGSGEGTYAFALSTQGRILFDMNILVREAYAWLDMDRRFLDVAKKHLNKYIITEDVTLVDRSAEFARLGVAGGRSAEFFSSLGVPQFSVMPSLGTTTVLWHGEPIVVARNDFCGPLGGEAIVSIGQAAAFRSEATDPSCAAPCVAVEDGAVHVHRIEAGIPWPGREITEEYLPAETRQLDRAVSFNKGCYLGQEVVERMRSRQVVARQLVGLTLEGSTPPDAGAAIFVADDKPIGTVTSACHSIGLYGVLALGYVKTAAAAVGTKLSVTVGDARQSACVAELPFLGIAGS